MPGCREDFEPAIKGLGSPLSHSQLGMSFDTAIYCRVKEIAGFSRYGYRTGEVTFKSCRRINLFHGNGNKGPRRLAAGSGCSCFISTWSRVGQAAKEMGHGKGDSDMFLRGKRVTGVAKYIDLVAMGYSSLSHGAKDGVLDSPEKVLSGVL